MKISFRTVLLLLAVGLSAGCKGGGASLSSGDIGVDGHPPPDDGGGGGPSDGPLVGSLGTGAGAVRNQGGVADPFSIAAFFAGASAAPPLANKTALAGAIANTGLPAATADAISNLAFTAPASWPPATATDAVPTPLGGTHAGTPYVASTDYAGAFDPALAVENQWIAGWSFALDGGAGAWRFFGGDRAPNTALSGLLAPSADGVCPPGTTLSGSFSEIFGPLEQDESGLFQGVGGDYDVCKLPGRILTFNFDISNDNVYEIADEVEEGTDIPGTYVGRGEAPRPGAQSLVRLRIQAGTLIVGDTNEALIVTRGASIQANGLQTAPIVMTSRAQLASRFDGDPDTSPGGDRGEWGGLVLMGTARDNTCTPDFPTCDIAAPAGIGFYGGNDDANETSGNLDYVVVRQAGGEMDTGGTRLGGVTLFGVGRNTRINNLQIHRSGSDGLLIRGGNVFLGHVLLSANAGDSLDFDNGWNGGMQHVLAIQEGDESQNGIRGASDLASEPVSFPLLANMTFMAPDSRTTDNRANSDGQGLLLLEGSRAQIWNSILTGDFFNGCVDLDDAETFARANEEGGSAPDAPGPHLIFRNSIVDCTQFNFNENG